MTEPRTNILAYPTFREPPHNLEAEQALIGAVLVNNATLDKVSDFLFPEHFSDGLHEQIFGACLGLHKAGRRASPVSLKTAFETAEPVGALTVPQYLGKLAANAVSIANAANYGRTVHDLAKR